MRKHWTLTIANPIWFICTARERAEQRASERRIAAFKEQMLADDLSVVQAARYAIDTTAVAAYRETPTNPYNLWEREVLDYAPDRVIVRA